MILDNVELVRQFSTTREGVTFDRFTLSIPAVNSFVARQKARAWVRDDIGLRFTVIRIVDDEQTSDVQTTFSDLFPEDFGREKFEVTVEAKRE